MIRITPEAGAINMWACTECDYSSKSKCNVGHHIEAKHIQHDGYYCFQCDKTLPSKGALRMHNKRNHSEQETRVRLNQETQFVA